MKTRLIDLIDKKTLKLINESVLGDLPSHKLMKMKWNPVTGKKAVKEANSDGTISPDEDKKRADMLKKFESELNKVVEKWKSLDGKVQIIIAVVAVFFLLALFFGSPVPDVQR